MRVVTPALTLTLCLGGSMAAAEEKFAPLFNGKDLDGWEGDPDLWKVADGVIVGSTENKNIEHSSFLATKKSYKNFILKTKFKLRNHNSGIQYRSRREPNFVVEGYQAEIVDNAFMGMLYEEGRGILANVDADKVAPHVNKGDWNEYVITANGPHLTQQLNGFTTVDYTEKDAQAPAAGVIALQLHYGPPKMQVEFKDLDLAELP